MTIPILVIGWFLQILQSHWLSVRKTSRQWKTVNRLRFVELKHNKLAVQRRIIIAIIIKLKLTLIVTNGIMMWSFPLIRSSVGKKIFGISWFLQDELIQLWEKSSVSNWPSVHRFPIKYGSDCSSYKVLIVSK